MVNLSQIEIDILILENKYNKTMWEWLELQRLQALLQDMEDLK